MSPAVRPPSSAMTIVKTRKTKARFDADVSERNGISAIPSAIDPSAPVITHTRLSSPCFMSDPPLPRSLRDQSIPHSRLGLDVARLGWIGLDLAPQMRHVDVQVVG